MKKITVLCCVMFLSFSSQAQMFEKGAQLLSLGVALPNGYTPIEVKYEYGLTPEIGVGGYADYSSQSAVSIFNLGILGNYHFSKALNSPKFDLYAGPILAKGFVSGGDASVSSEVYILANGGIRYDISDKLGIYARLHLGLVNSSGSNLGLGVTFKLNK